MTLHDGPFAIEVSRSCKVAGTHQPDERMLEPETLGVGQLPGFG